METTAYDEYNLQEKLTTLFNKAGSVYGDDVKNAFLSEISTIMLMIKQATSFEFYDGFKYDALNDKFKFTKETPSGAKILTFYNPPVQVSRKIVLTDKATRDTFALTYQGIYWERGSNLIKGFEYFGTEGAGHVEKQISVTFSILGDLSVRKILTPSEAKRKRGHKGDWLSAPQISPFRLSLAIRHKGYA